MSQITFPCFFSMLLCNVVEGAPHITRDDKMKAFASLWQVASIIMSVLIAVLTFVVARSGFEPIPFAILLFVFIGQIACFTLVGLSDHDHLSAILSKRGQVVRIVGGTAMSVMLLFTIMVWTLLTVTLQQ